MTGLPLFYPVELHWLGRSVFLLWRTNGTDAYVGTLGALSTWPNIEQLREHCAARGLRLGGPDTALLEINLDEVQRFVHAETELDSEALLNSWNFFLDVATTHASGAFKDLDTSLRDTYGALFSKTSAGRLAKLPAAAHNAEDQHRLRGIMAAGLSMVIPLLTGDTRA